MFRLTSKRNKSKLALKLVTLAMAVLFGLGIVELGLRLFGWADVVVFTPDPEFGFLMTPSQEVYTYGHPVRINSLGLRGPEPVEPKPPKTRRIVVVGDSVAYGGGRIREEELFCRIVESTARREGKNVEVVNLSAPAWSPQNWSKYIETRGLHAADMVVLVLPECDLARPLRTMRSTTHRTRGSFLRLGNVLYRLREMWTGRRYANGIKPAEVAAENCSAVKRLRQHTGSRPFVAVLVPSEATSDEEFWPPFEAQLPEAVDLRDSLTDGDLFLDGVHLNAEGHQLVAERILERLRGQWD